MISAHLYDALYLTFQSMSFYALCHSCGLISQMGRFNDQIKILNSRHKDGAYFFEDKENNKNNEVGNKTKNLNTYMVNSRNPSVGRDSYHNFQINQRHKSDIVLL